MKSGGIYWKWDTHEVRYRSGTHMKLEHTRSGTHTQSRIYTGRDVHTKWDTHKVRYKSGHRTHGVEHTNGVGHTRDIQTRSGG